LQRPVVSFSPGGRFPGAAGLRAMSKTSKIVDQEISVLSSSKGGLVFLTLNDWALVADKAKRVRFKKGDPLVQRGKLSGGVFLLLKGKARVQILSQPGGRLIGPGEICGEMSFLEDTAASVNVSAEEELEAYHLDAATLQSLFELFPHLGSRFYHSLATNLSRRLREVIGGL
jgi:CRP-like cAMP-binding protein